MKKSLLLSVFALPLAFTMACGEGNVDEENVTPADDVSNNDTEEAVDTNEVQNAVENNNENEAVNNGEERVYTVATDSNYVPFEFLDVENDEMVGFDIDLIHAIADRVGFTVDLEIVEFDGIVSGMTTGRYDIGIAGMTITEERAENFDFSDPYYDAGLIVAVRADEEEIESVNDLDGRPVSTRSGTTSETYLFENTEADVQSFPDVVNAYQDLVAGRVDAVVYDIPNVMYYIENEAFGEMKTVGDLLEGEQYGIAFPQDSELVDEVNEALEAMMDDGEYDEIYAKWFGDSPE